MLETNEEIRTGTVKEYVNEHEDENDQNRFLKADTKHIKKQQPMTIEVRAWFGSMVYCVS